MTNITITAIEGIELLTGEQAKAIYRCFGQDFAPYHYFVLINYHKVSIKKQPLEAYRASHDVGVFLVALDTSDCRHVLCGFHSDAERRAFLKTRDIMIPRV